MDDEALSFQRVMELTELPTGAEQHTGKRRFFSRHQAWVPGVGLDLILATKRRAFGGHVSAQAPFAACKALLGSEGGSVSVSGSGGAKFHLHTVQGCFSAKALFDLPFVYEVTPLTTGRTFRTSLVTARQPLSRAASAGDAGSDANSAEARFSAEDVTGPTATELGTVCYSCICTFKVPEPPQIEIHEPPPQIRFASILNSRPPRAWQSSPPLDVDAIRAAYPEGGTDRFPMLELRKVDMTAFNSGKELYDRRELILYRIRIPLPDDGDPNEHTLLHVFESDRNGLLMAGNHLGLGWDLGEVASLTCSFTVHVNAHEAVMKHGDGGGALQEENGDDGVWWVQEVRFPRAGRGRAALMSTIWSPGGVHVATAYQDGIVRRREGEGEGEKGKGKEKEKEKL